MQTATIFLLLTVVSGLMFVPALSTFAEQNISIKKQSPEADEIKAKLKAKAEAVQQKRVADLKIYMQQKQNRELSQGYAQKEMSLADKIYMQYQMEDKAKQEKQMLQKIMFENFKKVLAKQKAIQKEVAKDNVSLHGKKTIEYDRNQ